MANQMFICEHCGKYNFPFKNEDKKIVEKHELVCKYNPKTKSCDTCSHYKNYEKCTANFCSGWWCEIERQNSFKERTKRDDLKNYYDTGKGKQSNCIDWKQL